MTSSARALALHTPSASCVLTAWRRLLCSRCSTRSLSRDSHIRHPGVVGLYDVRRPTAYRRCLASCLVSDVVEKTSTRRRSRIPCVVVEKITTRGREGVGVVVEKNEESRRTFNKTSCDLLTAITHTENLCA